MRTDTHFDTGPGDFILYQGHIIAIYYGENSYSFTRLGRIDGATGEMMRQWLKAGEGNVMVTFSAKAS